MPIQLPPEKRNSICLAAVSEPSSVAPVSFRLSNAVSVPRKTFFPSCNRTATTFPPWPAAQRLRKNSTSASSGTSLNADETFDGFEEFLRIIADAILEDDFRLAQVGDGDGRVAID